MEQRDFYNLADSASENIYAFADFVKRTNEMFFDRQNNDLILSYREAWLNLEVVNAVALSQWEADGRPKIWDEQWRHEIKNEAIQAIDRLVLAANLVWSE